MRTLNTIETKSFEMPSSNLAILIQSVSISVIKVEGHNGYSCDKLTKKIEKKLFQR